MRELRLMHFLIGRMRSKVPRNLVSFLSTTYFLTTNDKSANSAIIAAQR